MVNYYFWFAQCLILSASLFFRDMIQSGVNGLNFLTWDCRGINDPVKHSKVLHHLYHLKAHIVFVQESHLKVSQHTSLRCRWVGQVFHSTFQSKARGIVILLQSYLLRQRGFAGQFDWRDLDMPDFNRFFWSKYWTTSAPLCPCVMAPPGVSSAWWRAAQLKAPLTRRNDVTDSKLGPCSVRALFIFFYRLCVCCQHLPTCGSVDAHADQLLH